MHDVVEVLHALMVDVDDGHLRAHADGDVGRVDAHRAAAEDDHVRRRHTWCAREEDAAAAVVGLKISRGDLRADGAGLQSYL